MHQIRDLNFEVLEVRQPELDMTEKLHGHVPPGTIDALVKVNMEAPVTDDDIIRAGGLGATDDLSSIISRANDFTDFEAHLHDVREYDDLNDKISGQDIPEAHKINFKIDESVGKHATPSPKDASEAVYMEAPATADDVIRAGGFGATDDIGSFLPVASDFTDFEAHLRDAEDYEDLKKDTARPGLGWTNDAT